MISVLYCLVVSVSPLAFLDGSDSKHIAFAFDFTLLMGVCFVHGIPWSCGVCFMEFFVAAAMHRWT